MGMYDAAMKREPPTKAVSAKNAQPEPGKPEEVPGPDAGFASAMHEHHTHAAGRHREAAAHHEKIAALHTKHAARHRDEAEYHEGKAGEY